MFTKLLDFLILVGTYVFNSLIMCGAYFIVVAIMKLLYPEAISAKDVPAFPLIATSMFVMGIVYKIWLEIPKK